MKWLLLILLVLSGCDTSGYEVHDSLVEVNDEVDPIGTADPDPGPEAVEPPPPYLWEEPVPTCLARPLEEHETPLEKAILDRAMECNRSPEEPDRDLLRAMLRLEEEVGVPPEMRGMVLAAACHESGFVPDNRGDYKCPGSGRLSPRRFRCKDGKWSRPKAIGILQQWPWWEDSKWGPKIDRTDPLEAAEAWLEHIEAQIEKVRKPCWLVKPKHRERLWVVAWVTAVRSPSKKPRCSQKPKHYARLLRWRTAWDHIEIQTAQR